MGRGGPDCLNRISASGGRGHRCPPSHTGFGCVKVSYRPCHNRERRTIATERRRSLTAPHEVPMLHPYIQTLTLAAALGACSALSFASSAHAAPFDGSWSVLVVTRNGSCGPSYRYGITIYNGVVSGSGAASVSGRVKQNGSVSVSVAGAAGNAYGAGRLSRNSGGGSWRGRGPSGTCSGSWTAQRGS